MTWQLAILFQQTASTAYALLFRHYAKNNPAQTVIATALTDLMVLAPVAIIWSFTMGGPQFDFPAHLWWLFLLTGFLFAAGNIAMYKASTKVEASRFTIISTLRTVVIVVASGLLLSEHLTPIQTLGALIILSASFVVISLNGTKHKKQHHDRYSVIAIVSAILIGLAVTAEKFLIGSTGLATYVFISWLLQTAFLTAFAWRQFGMVKEIVKKGSIKMLFVIGVLRSTAGVCFVTALALSNSASLIASVAAIHVVTTAIGGYIFLGERTHGRQKLAAALAAFVGVVLLVR